MATARIPGSSAPVHHVVDVSGMDDFFFITHTSVEKKRSMKRGRRGQGSRNPFAKKKKGGSKKGKKKSKSKKSRPRPAAVYRPAPLKKYKTKKSRSSRSRVHHPMFSGRYSTPGGDQPAMQCPSLYCPYEAAGGGFQ